MSNSHNIFMKINLNDKLYTKEELISLLEDSKIINSKEFTALYLKDCPNIQIGRRKLYQFGDVVNYVKNVKSDMINEMLNKFRNNITTSSKELKKYIRVRKKLGKDKKYIL